MRRLPGCIYLYFALTTALLFMFYHVTVRTVRNICSHSTEEGVLLTSSTENTRANSRNCSALQHKASEKSRASSDPRYMELQTGGRLANQMFEYAALLGIAKHRGYLPLRPTGRLQLVFNLTTTKPRQALTNTRRFQEDKCCVYDPCVGVLSPDFNWTLHGFFQSWRYFRDVPDLVRSEFKFKDSILEEVEAVFRDLGHYHRVKVGVHVRRGDMTLKKHLAAGYTVADETYFRNAMIHFRRKLTDPLFVVVSDDVTWAKRELEGPDVTFVHKTPEVDMAVLTRCSHVIISTGTFGWWGAWLAGGETVYFKNFPKAGSRMAKMFRTEDYFPPSWIAME